MNKAPCWIVAYKAVPGAHQAESFEPEAEARAYFALVKTFAGLEYVKLLHPDGEVADYFRPA